MKRTFLTLIILVTALTTLAQATQPCVVKQYNQKQQKTPLGGVQVEVRDAQSATSAANGSITLKFATLKPGDRVTLRAGSRRARGRRCATGNGTGEIPIAAGDGDKLVIPHSLPMFIAILSYLCDTIFT